VQKSVTQNGVAQVLSKMNFLSNVSHLRRVSTPINRDGKLPKPRELSISHYGILCPVETPEGQACGLVENFSFLCHVRIGSPAFYVVRQLFRDKLAVPLGALRLPWKVLVNGALEGYCADGHALAELLRCRRRRGNLPYDMSIATLDLVQNVILDTDPGCLLRPLIRISELEGLTRVIRGTPPPLVWTVCCRGASWTSWTRTRRRTS
jgi:DNA-directed RNA polymerase II subunit RPB2